VKSILWGVAFLGKIQRPMRRGWLRSRRRAKATSIPFFNIADAWQAELILLGKPEQKTDDRMSGLASLRSPRVSGMRWLRSDRTPLVTAQRQAPSGRGSETVTTPRPKGADAQVLMTLCVVRRSQLGQVRWGHPCLAPVDSPDCRRNSVPVFGGLAGRFTATAPRGLQSWWPGDPTSAWYCRNSRSPRSLPPGRWHNRRWLQDSLDIPLCCASAFR